MSWVCVCVCFFFFPGLKMQRQGLQLDYVILSLCFAIHCLYTIGKCFNIFEIQCFYV